MFVAHTSDIIGRKRHHAYAESRDAAAREVFKLDPKAVSCLTWKAHKESDGRLWNTGKDKCWHDRAKMDTA